MEIMVLSCNRANSKDYQDLYDQSVLLNEVLSPKPNAKGKCVNMMTKASECLPQASDKSTILTELETSVNDALGSPFGTVLKALLEADDTKYTTLIYELAEDPNQDIVLDQLTFSIYCESAVVSESFKKASERFKDCFYTCQAKNWSNYISKGLCSGSTEDLAEGSLGTGLNLCAIQCSKTTNN